MEEKSEYTCTYDEKNILTFFEPEKIKCEKHGETDVFMTLAVDTTILGKYCFICYNDFLSRILTNYK